MAEVVALPRSPWHTSLQLSKQASEWRIGCIQECQRRRIEANVNEEGIQESIIGVLVWIWLPTCPYIVEVVKGGKLFKLGSAIEIECCDIVLNHM